MKKILALLLAIALSTSCTIVSYAADDMPEPVFDMDLSDCNTTTIAIKDESGSGKVSSFSYGAGGNNKKPAYAVTEQGTPYLIFDDGNTSGPTNTVNVLFKDTSVHDADELTITAWVKETNAATRNSKYLFGFGPLSGSTFGYGIQYYNNQLRSKLEAAPLSGVSSLGVNPYSLGGATWPSTYTNEWKHVTITKKWTTSNAATNTGYYEVVAYVNGVKAGSYTNSKTPTVRQKYSDAFPTATYPNITMTIGGNATGSGDQSFPGAVADFKVYDSILTVTQIQSDYLETGSGYLTTAAVTGHSLSSVGRDDADFTVTFDAPVNKESLGTGVVIKDAEGGVINTAFKSYDEMSYVATFSILDYLEAGATYTLDLTGVRDANGFGLSGAELTFTAKDESEATISSPSIAYKNSEGTVVDAALATTADIAATVTNDSEETLTFFLSLSVKDVLGGAYKMDVSAPLTLTAGASDELTLNATGLIPGGAVVTRIWCMTESGKFYPLETPALLP